MFVRALVHEESLPRKSRAGDGLLGNIALTSIATDANVTLTVADIIGGAVQFTGFSAGRQVTTPTAAAILAAFSGMNVGDTCMLIVSVVPAFAATWAAGAGVTLAGRATTPASSYSLISVRKTSETTVTWTVM